MQQKALVPFTFYSWAIDELRERVKLLSFCLCGCIPCCKSMRMVCFIPRRVNGSPLKYGLGFLTKALPKQKPTSFQSFGNLELPACLDSAMNVGFFFFFLQLPLNPKNLP